MSRVLVFVTLLLGVVKGYSQSVASTYTFAAASGTYAGFNGTSVHVAGDDEVLSAAITLPFTFQYGCSNYTQVKISTNGWLTFNTSLSSAYPTNDLDNATNGITNPLIISPLWDNLRIYNPNGNTNDGIVEYTTTGSTPNQIFKVQWKNMEWNTGANANVMSFQVWLYEGSNYIEFIYSQGSGSVSSGSASIGLMGATTGDFISLNGSGASPTASTATETSNISAKPANGQIFRFTPNTCSGAPTAGTAAASLTSVCVGTSTDLSLTGTTASCGLTYQWQSSSNNSTWSNISGATSSTYTASPLATTYYRCVVSCGASSSNSSSIQVTVSSPTYATIPYSQDFETWGNFCNTNDVPNDNHWVNTPATGNNSWRRDNSGASGSWTTPASGMYSPAFSRTARSARFHSYDATSGSVGRLDLYVNLSAISGVKTISFDYINTSGTDGLSVKLSTDGGTSFPTTLTTLTTSSAWTRVQVCPNSNSTTAVLRFEATSDYGLTDIGIDNLVIEGACPVTLSGGSADATTNTVCVSGTSVTMSLTGESKSCGVTYQWQSSPNGSTWSNIAGATSSTYTTNVTSSLYYQCVISCGAATATSSNTLVALVTNTYAPIPYNQSFENTWTNICALRDAPDSYWRNNPSSGNASWRRNDDGVTSASWTSNSGAYTPAGSAGTYSARFHTYNSSSGTKGMLDFYVNLSGISGNKTLSFDYINTSGTDVMNVLLSTDGGNTFPTNISGALGNGTGWRSFNYCLTSNSTTAVIRFEATSDYNFTDIGIDNFNISAACSGTPTAGTATASPLVVCSAGGTTALKLTGASALCGISYQWQSSSNNSTWSNIAGATSTTYTATVSATTYYRCVVTCGASSSNTASVLVTVGAPSNDNCAGAIPLTVGASCNFTAGDVNCATQSVAGCSGGTANDDVWYSFVANGSSQVITVEASSSFDPVVQVFSGSCGGTSVVCNDASFLTGATGSLTVTGLTAGATYWIRVFDYWTGTPTTTSFNICVSDPPSCPAGLGTVVNIPSLPYTSTGRTTCGKGNELNSSNVGSCGSSIYFNGEDEIFVFTPTASGQITITQSNTGSQSVGIMLFAGCPFSSACLAYSQSSTSPKTICVNVSAGTTYYLVADSWPSPSCYSYDISISAPGGATATCNLNYATSSITKSTTNAEYTGGTSVTLTDDYFANSYAPIGFTFCFDGIAYTQCLISSNGYIIFDKVGCTTNLPGYSQASASGYSPYSLDVSLPDATESPRNAVLLTWQDINPNTGGTIKYQTTGVAPNRVFIVAFNDIPYYSCTSLKYKGLLKLYETSNIIEFHIDNKVVCSSWNDGNAILGLQNFDGTIARVPANRNGFDANWTTSNEAWRFTPGCTTCTTPLPVSMLDFHGEARDTYNEVSWSTATELNNSHFVLEHSPDGINFTEIGTIEGHGTTNAVQKYSYLDKSPYKDVTYYRLVQFDYNGRGNMTEIISVRTIGKRSFDLLDVYPVPSSDKVTVSMNTFEAGVADVSVLELTGRVVTGKKVEFEKGNFQVSMDLNEVPSGVYLVRVAYNGGDTQVKRIIKK